MLIQSLLYTPPKEDRGIKVFAHMFTNIEILINSIHKLVALSIELLIVDAWELKVCVSKKALQYV